MTGDGAGSDTRREKNRQKRAPHTGTDTQRPRYRAGARARPPCGRPGCWPAPVSAGRRRCAAAAPSAPCAAASHASEHRRAGLQPLQQSREREHHEPARARAAGDRSRQEWHDAPGGRGTEHASRCTHRHRRCTRAAASSLQPTRTCRASRGDWATRPVAWAEATARASVDWRRAIGTNGPALCRPSASIAAGARQSVVRGLTSGAGGLAARFLAARHLADRACMHVRGCRSIYTAL